MKYVNLDFIGKIIVKDIQERHSYMWQDGSPATTRRTWWGGTRKVAALPTGWIYYRDRDKVYTEEEVLDDCEYSCILNKKLYYKPYLKIVYVNDMSSDTKHFDDFYQAKDMAIALMNNSEKKFELIFE